MAHRMQHCWDLSEAHIRRNPRKYAAIGAVGSTAPLWDWATSASQAMWAAVAPATLSILAGSAVIWITVALPWISAAVGVTLMALVWWQTSSHAGEGFVDDGPTDAEAEEMIRAHNLQRRTEELSASREAMVRERDAALADVQHQANENDKTSKALAMCKRDFALERIRWFAERVRRHQADVRVTVRFAVYEDFDLVKQIEAIITKETRWPVTIDGSNNPTIAPDPRLKVIFESGISQEFDEIASAFSDGELVSWYIGTRTADRATNSHLVIEILPSLQQQPAPSLSVNLNRSSF